MNPITILPSLGLPKPQNPPPTTRQPRVQKFCETASLPGAMLPSDAYTSSPVSTAPSQLTLPM